MRKIWMDGVNGLRYIVEIIIPKGRDQKLVFYSFLVFYVLLSLLMYLKHGLMAWQTNVLNYDVYMWIDRLSSIEYLAPYRAGLRHPLFTSLILPVTAIAIFLKAVSGKLAIHVLFFFLLYNFIAAFSNTIVYKYCSAILNIGKRSALLICLLFSLFAHNLVLSFLPETFPLAMLGLLVMIYLTSDSILNKKEIPLATNIILFSFISGVTITNSMKCAIAQLFQMGKSLRQRMEVVLKSGLICLGLCILSISIAYVIQIFLYGKWMMGDNTGEFISSIKGVDIFQVFFSEPLLFHHNYDFFTMEFVKPLLYHGFIAKITVIAFYCLVLFTLLSNIKDKIILFLLSVFSIDVLIHFVFGFGIEDSYIYSQHWFFICPLAIAVAYRKIQNTKIKAGMDLLLIIFIITFAYNNLPLLVHFLNQNTN